MTTTKSMRGKLDYLVRTTGRAQADIVAEAVEQGLTEISGGTSPTGISPARSTAPRLWTNSARMRLTTWTTHARRSMRTFSCFGISDVLGLPCRAVFNTKRNAWVCGQPKSRNKNRRGAQNAETRYGRGMLGRDWASRRQRNHRGLRPRSMNLVLGSPICSDPDAMRMGES